MPKSNQTNKGVNVKAQRTKPHAGRRAGPHNWCAHKRTSQGRQAGATNNIVRGSGMTGRESDNPMLENVFLTGRKDHAGQALICYAYINTCMWGKGNWSAHAWHPHLMCTCGVRAWTSRSWSGRSRAQCHCQHSATAHSNDDTEV